MKIITLTIEDDKSGERLSREFTCDDCLFSMERGIRHIFDSALGPDVVELQTNGQYRWMLTAWRGCSEYKTFVSEECIDRQLKVT